MTRLAGLIALLVFAAAPLPLMAYPDGAPWGSADPEGAQNCASCHYAEDAVRDSSAILVTGLPREVERGKTYSFHLSLADLEYASIGFLAAASHGRFLNVDGENTTVLEAMVRSTKPKYSSDAADSWVLEWEAPADMSVGESVAFDLAVNASNDDASPFGDAIHYRTIQISVK